MEKVTLYTIPSLYRDDFRIEGYVFGKGEKSLCILGNMRGNEYQQVYTCSQMVQVLKKLEEEKRLIQGKEILVVPSLNPCSMNIGKRFWPTDNTDINRMFPGYLLGETTQRIAAGIFDTVSQYKNGIQLASFYMPGKFSPHVRIMKTGFENVEKARTFGLPYIVLRMPKPYDTTTLNYNWQIWETDAYSLYTTTTEQIDEESSRNMISSILRFMSNNGMIVYPLEGKRDSKVFRDEELISVRPRTSGTFRNKTTVGQIVKKGEILAWILDTCEGNILEELKAPVDGKIFFQFSDPLVYANTAAIKILPDSI